LIAKGAPLHVGVDRWAPAILEADFILLTDCSYFDAEAVDDGEGTSGNELRGVAKAGRS
jgi:hypothetical protein